jgi:hypothetical protein
LNRNGAFTYGGDYTGTSRDFGQADEFQQTKQCDSDQQYCSTVIVGRAVTTSGYPG